MPTFLQCLSRLIARIRCLSPRPEYRWPNWWAWGLPAGCAIRVHRIWNPKWDIEILIARWRKIKHCRASVSEAAWWAGVSSHRKLSLNTVRSRPQLSVCILLRWLCRWWRVASVSSDVPLSAAVLRVKNWALIRVSLLRTRPVGSPQL